MKAILFKSTAILTVVVILFQPFSTQASINDIFKGWSWTPNIGWISMNATNTNAANDYGVSIDDSRNITGWAWSNNIGWICFGTTCPGSPPGGGGSWAILDNQAMPEVHGWARIYSLYTINPTGSEGWISLNCASYGSFPARNVCATSNYYVYTNFSDGLFRGYGWNCTTIDGTGSCDGSKYTGGIGWIRFDPVYIPPPETPAGTFGGVPWVQVLYGDLYAKGGLNTPSPFSSHFEQVNAYYCLDKGIGSTVQRFTQGDASRCATGTVSTNINTPKQETNYSNALGRIKLRGYTPALVPINETDLAAGKYGPWSHVGNLGTDIPSTLGGRVYDTVTAGSFTLPTKTFNNAAGTGSGAGLIIVRGTLVITGDLLYQNAAITKLPQLASLGIVVLEGGGMAGDVIIESGVEKISANIYAEGTISTGTTGDPTTDQPLEINGVVVAKQFKFERQYPGGVDNPSEKILYDGRIVANTPPGMSDFTASLPVVSY